jgi:hypothetical protein
MSKGLRLTEKWMQRGLWLVAFVFAGFLIGLGGKIVDNMWRVEPPAPFDSFIDPVRGPAVRAAATRADANRVAATERLEQAMQQHRVAQSNSRTAEQTFANWLSTRSATAPPPSGASSKNRRAKRLTRPARRSSCASSCTAWR